MGYSVIAFYGDGPGVGWDHLKTVSTRKEAEDTANEAVTYLGHAHSPDWKKVSYVRARIIFNSEVIHESIRTNT